MSDVNDTSTKREFSEADKASFKYALTQRQKILESLGKGNLSCLPGQTGLADTSPVVNLTRETEYSGMNVLYLKEHQKQNGFPMAEYLTPHQLEKAKEFDPDLAIKQGEKPAHLLFSELNKETGKWDKKIVELYNIAQTNNPEQLKEWAILKHQEKVEKMVSQFSESYTDPKPKMGGAEISCTSTDPEKYIGQYLAAIQLGKDFKVSPEQAKEFSQKMDDSLNEKMDNGYPNPFKLSEISIAASQFSKEFKSQIEAQDRKAKREQHQEHKHDHSL